MSQSKVNDYFSFKKRGNAQAAKKRKITLSSPEIQTKKKDLDINHQLSVPEVPSCSKYLGNKVYLSSKKTNRVPPRSKSVGRLSSKTRKCSTKGDKSQSNLLHLLSKSKVTESASKSQCCGDKEETYTPNRTVLKDEEALEEITSEWDDHSENFSTPRKKKIPLIDFASDGVKSRTYKIAKRKFSNEDHEKEEEIATVPSPRKQIIMTGGARKKILQTDESFSSNESELPKTDCLWKESKMHSKKDLLKMYDTLVVPAAISPLSLTPDREKCSDKTNASSPEAVTPHLKDLSFKLKSLSKMNGEALKNRLKQSGKFDLMKEKLQNLNKSLEKNKVTKVVESKEKTESEAAEEKLPAYQRFDYLTVKDTSALPLPYTYKLLGEAFQAMDTVVSMMHNRNEICTYTKLQDSVQNITKKKFQEKTVGQIKTVVDDAYIFRQEKNIPTVGKKKSGYQLTVEANLAEKEDSNAPRGGKCLFSATALLKRKQLFQHNLMGFVKKYHQDFLSSLNPPLKVSDDKITRWHPKFRLDAIPEIVSSPIPQPPDLQVLRSAKDVLELQKGKIHQRLEDALQKVCERKEMEPATPPNSTNVTPVSSPSKSPLSSPQSTSPSLSSLKGIPPALLAKIRAKDALKQEQALIRDPSEDLKSRMMSRLPEMIRILRSHFITEKKPALPLDSCIKKLEDSYRSGISSKDVELHINLLKELAPELVAVVAIKRGKFLKLDKNVDVRAVCSRINNLVKARK